MTREPGIGRSTMVLLIGNIISGVIGIVRGFYIARFLLPPDYGAWTLLSTSLEYGNYVDLGINNGAMLKVPKLIGRTQVAEGQCVMQQAYASLLVVCGGYLIGSPATLHPSTGWKLQVFGALAVGMRVEAGLVAVLVQTAWGIEGAALAVLISAAVYGGLVAFFAVRLFGGNISQQLARAALCFVPFAITLPVSALLLMANPLNGTLWNDLFGLTAHVIVYLLICAPLYLLVAWMIGLPGRPFLLKYKGRWSLSSLPALLRKGKQ